MNVLLMDRLDYNISKHIQNSVAYIANCLASYFVWGIPHKHRNVKQFLFRQNIELLCQC